MKQALTEAYNNVRDNQEAAHLIQSQLYNKKIHGEAQKVGDLVWLHSSSVFPGKLKKLFHPWIGRYYRMIDKICDAGYNISNERGVWKETTISKINVVHLNQLKLFCPGTRLP